MRVSAKAQGIVATDSDLNLHAIHRCRPQTPPPFNLWPAQEEPLGPLIGSRTLDTCLTWFDRDENGVWTVAVSEPNEGLRAAVLGGSHVRADMLVTPDFMIGTEDEELARTTFAIEPQTGLVNTLSLEQTGPIPGREHHSCMGVGRTERAHQLRALIRLIEKHKRAMIFTDFEDTLGSAEVVTIVATAGLPKVSDYSDTEYIADSTMPQTVTITMESFEKFKQKARAFLRKHDDDITIHRLRTNKPLTESDLE